MCPADEFATGFDESGRVVCSAITATARASLNDHCSLYYGWRDSCDGCTSTPAKWGRVGGVTCVNGTGADSTCSTASLGGVSVNLYGVNVDGDVNDDDKFYAGFHCVTPTDDRVAGPCPAGSFMAAVTTEGPECVTGQAAVVDYLANQCNVYAGWRDSCDGCTSAPSKWGNVNTALCTIGTGAANTCTFPPLGGQNVRMFGVNTDGNVNGDDKFYFGFQCTGAMAADATVPESCPAGQLVVGIDDLGMVLCASPLVAAEAVVQNDCYLYAGWRDSCDGCVTAPAKWGRVSHKLCENGVGADNTCSQSTLNGVSLPLFGLNTDGDVDGNDKFYVGLLCQ